MDIKSIGIINKKNACINKEILIRIFNVLCEKNIDVYMESLYEEDINIPCNFVCDEELYKNSDVILSLGGDGTLIHAASNAAIYNKPVIGMNLGNLGFLSEMERDDLSGLYRLLNGEYIIDERMMLTCEAVDINDEKKIFHCLNDIIISRGSYPRMINFDLSVSGQIVENYTADGMIISTPTGSTAYSLSAGGPIAEPVLDIIIATPICPHSFKNKSIIFGSDKEIIISVNEKYNNRAFISVDGNTSIEIQGEICIRKSEFTTKLLRINNKSFYSILKDKLADRGGN